MRRPELWKFYIYIIGDIDSPLYIGKGSGRRLKNQEKNYKAKGVEYARFYNESKAYEFERQLIEEMKPTLNKAPGGAGSRVQKVKPPRIPKWFSDFARECRNDPMYSRKYAARFLLSKDLTGILPSANIRRMQEFLANA